jgi:hypothetical protein
MNTLTANRSDTFLPPVLSERSMLQALRAVAIARVRTVLVDFDDTALDRWIMSTGYEEAPNPHFDAADLLYVYAASLSNAAAAQPNAESFGRLIRSAAVRCGLVSRAAPDLLHGALPTVQGLAQACVDGLQECALRGRYDDALRQLAAGRPAGPPMTGLLLSVLKFSEWLRERFEGSASNLHRSLIRSEGVPPSAHVIPLLEALDTLPRLGIATAANFIKDSQASGLRALGMDPSTARAVPAGWFVSPNLHVSRLMACITGRLVAPSLSSAVMPAAETGRMFAHDPAGNFIGHYDDLSPAGTFALRVIADIHEWAECVGTSALEIDRVLHLIGAQVTSVHGRRVDAPWYPFFARAFDQAVKRGVPPKS